MSDVILKIDNLTKTFRSYWTYRPLPAVKNLSLEINAGESFGFLGHNGAGKTTSIKCILGLIHKTSGRIELDGRELVSPSQLKMIGYLPEQPYFYDHLTVEETLGFFASLHGIKGVEKKQQIIKTLERVGLYQRKKSPVRSLSKGLQQRLGLAQAIINQPQLLLLDEPFSGLDPIGRLEFREIMLELKQKGTTLVLSSHILSDVEDICDRVSIMVQGELKTVFALADAPALFGECYELIVSGVDVESKLFSEMQSVCAQYEMENTNSGAMHIFRFHDYDAAHVALKNVTAAGAHIHNFQSKSLRLEDIFMNITGQRQPHNRLPGSDRPELRH